MATSYDPPVWVKSNSDSYKRWLNRKANSLMKLGLPPFTQILTREVADNLLYVSSLVVLVTSMHLKSSVSPTSKPASTWPHVGIHG